MKQRKEIPYACLNIIPSLLRRGNSFVRYSDDDGRDVGVYTTLHPYRLSSVLRVVYQVNLPGSIDGQTLEHISGLVDDANAAGTIGTFSIEKVDGHNTLRLLQLLWVDHRPTKESLEELLSAGDTALRTLYAKTKKGELRQ